MSSVSFSNVSLRPLDLLLSKPETVQQEPAVKRPTALKAPEPPTPEAVQSVVAALPSTVDMRFELNALTNAWMLAMTDSGSGDVVRKIPLKGLSNSSSGLHQSGHWIDKAV
jgi:hypothetical protein